MSRPAEDLRDVVGTSTYAVWKRMLEVLVPDGRSHRLAVVIASMLQYASHASYRKHGSRSVADRLAVALIEPAFGATEYGPEHPLHRAVAALLADAGVKDERVSTRGDRYSLVDQALAEFDRWHELPWKWRTAA